MSADPKIIRGRGALDNPTNRFEKIHLEKDLDTVEAGDDDVSPRTQIFKDNTQTALTRNDSPDVGFEFSVNPYRGCEHGCIYCFARPTHEFLGWSSGLDFETKILVKENAPALLRKDLSAKKWKPQTVIMSGVTDCYQPLEKKLRITRGCLEVFAEFRNPVAIITKNHLVTRDIDLLQRLAEHNAVRVNVSVTTLDSKLAAVMEPRTSMPEARIDAIRQLSRAGIPVNVMVAPIVPAITDHEIISIIGRAVEAGATSAGYTVMRLPYAVKDLFTQWVQTHFPDRSEKVLNRIRELRGGKLNDSTWGTRMHGEGIFAEQIAKTFDVACRKFGIDKPRPEMSTASFRRPPSDQLELL
ncbi:MAG: Radical domain protein [Verrucomicrobiales bacterium]|nr:Radical domain protein [Verrucomicrobiales bacterium]